MAGGQVTKIYELKTLGYDETIRQLTNIEKSFSAISKLKKELNQQKYTTTDADDLAKVNQALDDAKIKSQQLKLEKIQLANAANALKNAQTANTNATKAQTAANQAQAGSYNDLLTKQKELYAVLKNAAPGSTLSVGGKVINYDQAITEYKRLAAAEQAFRRQFQADAVLIGEYTSGIVNAFRQMGLGDLVGAQVTKATARLKELDREFEILKTELQSVRQSGGNFDAIEQKLIKNRQEAAQLNAQVKQLQANLQGMGSIGNQITTGLANGFANFKNQLSQLLITYVGFFAAFRAITDMVKHNAELSDSFADLQIRVHGTKQDVEDLFSSLKKLDTRTSLAGLVDIANIVAKKGVAKDEIVGITKALDSLFIVLGKEAGDTSEATSSIIKLISIFNDDKHVTAERVNEIGTALFKLTTTGVATGAFLINFAERVGSVRGITGLTLPVIFGMGAALQQLGQRVEVAGTAAVQLSTKLFANVPKFAEAAKVTVEEFRKLLAANPFDALVKTAQGLANLNDADIAKNFEEIVQAFNDVGIVGVRVKTVLADIATNGEFVKQRMKDAAVTTADYANAVAGSQLKQETFAATLEKIKKQFETFGTSSTVRATLLGIAGVVSVLVGILPTLLVLLGLLATAWLVQNAAMIAARAQVILYNLALAGLYITQGALYILQAAYIVGLAVLRAAWAACIIVARAFNAVLALTPLGLFITGLLTVGGVLSVFAQKLNDAQDKLKGLTQAQKDHIIQARIAQEVAEKSNEIIGEQISKLEALAAVVLSTKTSYDTQRLALEELTKQYSAFGQVTDVNAAGLAKFKTILAQVREEIQLNANAQAAASLSAEKYKEYLTVVTSRQKIERYQAQGGSVNGDQLINFFENLPAEQRNVLMMQTSGQYFSKKYFDSLKKLEQDKLTEYQDYNQFASDIQAKVLKTTAEHNKAVEIAAAKTIEQLRQDALNSKQSVEELTALIQGIDKQRDKLKEGDPKLAELARLRDVFQARLDALNNKKGPKGREYRGAKIPGAEKDDLAEIDAQMKLELAKEEERFARLQVITIDGQERLHDAEYGEELNYIIAIRNINKFGLQDKIDLLEKKKTLNARELDLLATFKEQQAKLELKYVQDVKALNEKTFKDEADTFKKQLDAKIASLQEENARTQALPDAYEEDKARKQKETDDKILALTKAYYVTLDALAKKYSISHQTIEEEKQKAISKLVKDGLTDELKITKAIQDDIIKAHEKYNSEIKAIYAARKLAVINSNDSQPKKDAQLKKLDRDEEELLLNSEVGLASSRLIQIRKDFAAGKATLKELQDAETAYEESVRKLADYIKKVPTSLDKIREGARGLGEAIAKEFGLVGDQALLVSEAFQVAEQAMNSYFDNERARIQHSLDINQKRLDVELQQRKDRAQGSAEQASLDKQYAEKKLELEKQAFEKTKKLQLSQLAINFAIQLSNIALAASANPLNPFTFGAAGIAQYIIQAALATVSYAINRNSIKSQQFEYGGRVGGKTHAQGGNKFMFQGRMYEDEVGELNIIRTKNVQEGIVHTISGTHGQIASKLNVLGGGVEFQPGAKTFATGGVLGSSYTAPNYVSSAQASGADTMQEIRNLANEMAARIDRIQVLQVTNTVTSAQRKIVKQEQIGTI